MDFADFELGRIFGTLLRRWRMVLVTTALTLVLAAMALVFITPQYSAIALVQFDPSANPLEQSKTTLVAPPAQARGESEVEIMRSNSVLLRLLRDQPELTSAELRAAGSSLWEAESLSEGQSLDLTLRQLAASLSIQRRGLTNVIAVQARSTSPDRAAALADALVRAHLGNQVDRKVATIRAAQRAVETQRDVFDGTPSAPALASQAAELNILAGLQLPESILIAPAVPPARPSFPNSGLTLGLAGFFGLLAGISLALIAENKSGGFIDEEEIQSTLRTRTAAPIPRTRITEEMSSPADTIVETPLAAFAEAMRRLQTSCDLLLRQGEVRKVIMVTAAAPGAGATTTALALARTYALQGRSTLLIDANLRAPGINRHLSLFPQKGLLEELQRDGEPDVSQVIAADPHSILTVLVGAHPSERPTDHMLMGREWANLLAVARRTYEIIVLDSVTRTGNAFIRAAIWVEVCPPTA